MASLSRVVGLSAAIGSYGTNNIQTSVFWLGAEVTDEVTTMGSEAAATTDTLASLTASAQLPTSFTIGDDVQSSFRGDLLPFLRHQRYLLRLCLQSNLHDLLGRGHFEIQFHLHGFAENTNIAILDVSSIFAKVNRDSVSPSQFSECSGPDRIRLDRLSSLADSGNVINVDSKAWHVVIHLSGKGQWLDTRNISKGWWFAQQSISMRCFGNAVSTSQPSSVMTMSSSIRMPPKPSI